MSDVKGKLDGVIETNYVVSPARDLSYKNGDDDGCTCLVSVSGHGPVSI